MTEQYLKEIMIRVRASCETLLECANILFAELEEVQAERDAAIEEGKKVLNRCFHARGDKCIIKPEIREIECPRTCPNWRG